MDNVTRRGFIKNTAVGAAAVGMLGAVPSLAFAQTQSTSPLPVPGDSAGTLAPVPANPVMVPGGPTLAGPVVVYITDPASGKGVIYVGEQEFQFDSQALVQSVLQAIA